MQRLFDYFRYYGISDPLLEDFLVKHGEIIDYDKNGVYNYTDVVSKTWCFILNGSIAFISYADNGKSSIQRIYTEKHYFSGTKHPFSESPEPHSTEFLRQTTIFEMRNEHYKEALKLFPSFQEFVQIIKQHEINMLRHTLHVVKIPTIERVAYLQKHLPEIDKVTTVEQKCSFLIISNNREYYKAVRYAFKKR